MNALTTEEQQRRSYRSYPGYVRLGRLKEVVNADEQDSEGIHDAVGHEMNAEGGNYRGNLGYR